MNRQRASATLVGAASQERGAMLIDALIGVSVLTLLGAAVLSGMSTTHRAAHTIESSAIAENIARSHVETILASPYQSPPHVYETPFTSIPSGYEVVAEAQQFREGNVGIALIVVEVTQSGAELFRLEAIRQQGP